MVITKIGGGGIGVLKSIAEAIGEPATPKDKKGKLVEIIDNAQIDIASLCNEKGCNIPDHPTFPEIVTGLKKVTHFLQSVQINNMSAQVGFSDAGKMILSWENPISDRNYSGVMIRYKADSYPVSQTDGILIYDSNGALPASETATLTGLTDGTAYYIRGFAYSISGASRIYTTSTAGAQCTAIPMQIKGQQVFTASTVWTVPYGVSSVDVFLVGGGGSGCPHKKLPTVDNYCFEIGGGGGGGGYTATYKNVSVVDGEIPVIVGSLGANSSFGEITVLSGKNGGNNNGGNGGSGGGIGGFLEPPPSYKSCPESAGGTDGSDGFPITGGTSTAFSHTNFGTGQGTTTRAFGETDGTLYASGGSGGNCVSAGKNGNIETNGQGIVMIRWGY